MKAIAVFALQILSEPDNHTPSFIRIGAVLFGATAIGLAIVSTAMGNPFDASGFLIGAAGLLGGSGIGARAVEGPQQNGE